VLKNDCRIELLLTASHVTLRRLDENEFKLGVLCAQILERQTETLKRCATLYRKRQNDLASRRVLHSLSAKEGRILKSAQQHDLQHLRRCLGLGYTKSARDPFLNDVLLAKVVWDVRDLNVGEHVKRIKHGRFDDDDELETALGRQHDNDRLLELLLERFLDKPAVKFVLRVNDG